MSSIDADAFARARYFVALGFSVFPVPPPEPGAAPNTVGDGKTPARKWREWQTRRATDAELMRLFRDPLSNIAIVTGAISDLIVVDLDSLDAVKWGVRTFTYTPWQCKTSRGYHLYFRYPGAWLTHANKIATPAGPRLPVDLRGDGGYVIAPGSQHASGAEYRFAGKWAEPRDRVPVFWPGWLERPHEPRRIARPTPRPGGPALIVIERARRYLAAIPRPEIGAGSDVAMLSAACRLVRGFDISASDAERLLWDWAGGRPGWTRAWIARKVRSAEKYGSEPVGALR